ncbi:MAG: GNAT family N-acetyltransferase [Betaproteobacteria bacterium]|nr:GNAT family N-acetyltransferase [Betaproteobacteria bacterium]
MHSSEAGTKPWRSAVGSRTLPSVGPPVSLSGTGPDDHPSVRIHRGYLPGCIGRIVELHGRYYSAAAGFGLTFESKVARELATFCESMDETHDGLWLALVNDEVVGSIAIDGGRIATHGAHLRWFIVRDDCQGRGAGSRLMSEAMNFLSAIGCARAHLWTFSGLDAARHLYERHGFRLVEERPGDQWGVIVNEQYFVRGERQGA